MMTSWEGSEIDIRIWLQKFSKACDMLKEPKGREKLIMVKIAIDEHIFVDAD